MINLIAVHKSRFFSLLSLFAVTMLILVTGENLLIILLGWEGEQSRLISLVILPFINKESKKLTSYQRIGPHNKDVISIIFGSVLGDGHLEKRSP
jgi:hypothetical protein